MNFTALLDTAIGVTLVYLGAALFVTILSESIARTFRLRGRALAEHLTQLFDDDTLKKALGSSNALAPRVSPKSDVGRFLARFPAWIQGYEVGGGVENGKLVSKIESYVDPDVVARVVLGSLLKAPAPGTAGTPTPAATMQEVRDTIANLTGSSKIKTVLWQAAASAKDDLDKFTAQVSGWLDKSLNMLGEGYKTRSQVICFFLGLVMAVAANIDTVELTRRLYTDKGLRDSTVASAEQLTKSVSPELVKKCGALSFDELQKDDTCTAVTSLVAGVARRNETLAKLPIGWVDAPPFKQDRDVYLRLVGWLLTALALSLGAPFWFDLLNRFVNIRGSARKDGDGKSA
jgi:hypothetical protein